MKVTFWGTRGSLASPGPETVRYGGNTACVEIRDSPGGLIILDAGTGIRRLGATLGDARKIHLFLTHLHLDHLQGLGFFAPLFRPEVEVHIWGPPSLRADLAERLNRYLSPPLFPVRLKELGSRVTLHPAPTEPITIGKIGVVAELVIHPGQTVGYRLSEGDRAVAYLPDHEPALGVRRFPGAAEWTSGYALAKGVDLLIHDAQYTAEERSSRIGWVTARSTRQSPSPKPPVRQPLRLSTMIRPIPMTIWTTSSAWPRSAGSSSSRQARA